MKFRKFTAVFVSITLALGLCPLPAYAAADDLAAGTPSEPLGAAAADDAAAIAGSNAIVDESNAVDITASTLGSLSEQPKQYTDHEGEHVFYPGEAFECEDTPKGFKYYLRVLTPPDAAGQNAVAALIEVADISETQGSEATNSTVKFTVPAAVTYTYLDSAGQSFNQQFAITQLGSDFETGSSDLFYIAHNVEKLIIPATVTTVCRFGSNAYLKKLEFEAGSTVWEIPDNFLFEGATALTSVVLPNSVERIGKNAFSKHSSAYASSENCCPRLESVTMPASLESIDDYAFLDCYRLQNANLSACTQLKSIGDKAFYNTHLSSLVFPDSLETIGYGAFAWKAGGSYYIGGNPVGIPGPTFTRVDIPANVTSIGGFAFASAEPKSVGSHTHSEELHYVPHTNSAWLSSLYFAPGSNLKYIGDYAFAGTAISNTLTLPASVKTLGADEDGCSHVFYDCDELKSVVCEDAVGNPSQLEVFGGFGDCDKLASVTMPFTNLREIAPEAFARCASMKTFEFPVNIELIGAGAFEGAGLTSVDVPATVATIGEDAFSASSALETATIAAPTIGPGAFSSCGALHGVTLAKGVKTIGAGAFSACLNLQEIEIPASVSRIGEGAFTPNPSLYKFKPLRVQDAESVGLESLTIKPGYTALTIEDGAFLGCVGLGGTRAEKNTIVLPERVNKIGGGAFMYINNAIFEIHNPSVVFTSGEGYLYAELPIEDARFFTDDEADEDGVCAVYIPDPWQSDDYYRHPDPAVLNDVRDGSGASYYDYTVVRYPNTVTRNTSPSFAIFLDQVNLLERGREHQPKLEPVDPSTFPEEEIDLADEIVEVEEAGRLLVTTTGAAGSNAYVCVYNGSRNLVASGQAGRGLAIIEGLAAGTYTVTAFAANAGFKSVDSLDSYADLGLAADDYAKQTGVIIADDADTKLEGDNALEVPALTTIASASDFIQSSSMAVSKKDIYKNTQFFATFNYKMKSGKTATHLVLKAPQGLEFTSVTSANEPEPNVANANTRTLAVPLNGKDKSSGRICIGLRATKTGTFTFNASLTCDNDGAGVTFPAGNATVTCNAISLELPEAAIHAQVKKETVNDSAGNPIQKEYLQVKPFKVDVYAAPNTEVTVTCAGWTSDDLESKPKTNRNGHVEVNIDPGKLETALSYATVLATVTDGGNQASAQGTVQFAADQRDPYTLKDFSFVHAGTKYDIVKNGRPLSRGSYYTYIANGKESNKYWSFEAVYITDSPLWVGGRASAVMQNISCTLQVQMADGSSRYENMALLGSEPQGDGTYLNRFATTLYLDQAGDHVFPTSLIPAAFGVSLYAPESTNKPLTKSDIEGMRAQLYAPFTEWKAEVQRAKKANLVHNNAGWANEFFESYFDEDYSEILFFTRTRIWEVYEDVCDNPEEYGFDTTLQADSQAIADLQDFVDAGNQASDWLGTLFDASISATTSISQCGSMIDWLGKNANYKSGVSLGADAISKLADAGWNVTADDGAVSMPEGGGTPTKGLGVPNPEFKEPTTFATKLNKDNKGNLKSMSYRDSNGNSLTLNKPFDTSVNQKYSVDWFNANDCANLLSNVFSVDNLLSGKFLSTDLRINAALEQKLGSAKYAKCFPNGVNASLYGVGFAQALNLGQTAVDGYKQYLDSEALIEAFKDADRARDKADNLTVRLNAMIKSGEYLKDPKCYKALKEERNWAIIVADGLKAHAQLSEVEGWRNFGMMAGGGLAGACSGGIGSGIMYGVDKFSGKFVANEMNSNQSVLSPAMRNLLAAHRQRMIDCGETGDDAPYPKPAILDPSGVVYEAWPGNPLEGVTAEVLELTSGDGSSETDWSHWAAEEYDQENPQTTKADGAFSWDVPVGTWKVGFVKDGYANAETEVMDVPPPRMGLQQAMVADAAPAVKSMTADTKSIEVTFSQYMDASEVPRDVTVNGNPVTNAEWVDVAEWTHEVGGVEVTDRFSKMLRIPVPANTKLGDALNVSVGATKSYADKNLAAQERDIVVAARPAKIQFNFPDTISMQAGTSRPATVRVYDADNNPMQGLALTASLDNNSLATVDDTGATTDASGAAKLQVEALLPGVSELTVGIEGYELTRTVTLLTTADTNQAVRPVAVLGSTTFGPGAPIENAITVEKGTQLRLSCETQDATIYYTIDGSCPCQNTPGRKTYTGPITINANTYIIIASYKDGMDYSEKLKLNVTVKDAKPNPQPTPTPALKDSTISLVAQTSTYNGKAIAYTNKVSRTGSTGKVTFAYYKDANCTKGVAASSVKAAGTYYVRATVAADANYKAATSKAVKLVIKKAANPMKVSGKSPTVKYSKVKKKAVTIKRANAFKITKSVGTLSFKKTNGNKKVKVATDGKVKVLKGLKAGKYSIKVKVTAKGNANYNKVTKNATVKVVVSKK